MILRLNICSILILHGLSISFCFSQDFNAQNQTDHYGNRQGEWTILYDLNWEELPLSDTSIYTYFREVEYLSGIPTGQSTDYYNNGQKYREGKLISDSLEEYYEDSTTFYYRNGNILTSGKYAEGQQEGIWKCYFNNGNISHEEKYLNDRLVNPPLIEQIFSSHLYKKISTKKAIQKFSNNLPGFSSSYHSVALLERLVDGCIVNNNEKDIIYIRSYIVELYEKNIELFPEDYILS